MTSTRLKDDGTVVEVPRDGGSGRWRRRLDAEEGLVVHYGPGDHASERPDLVVRALSTLRHTEGFAA